MKKRILIAIDSLGGGGAEKVLKELLNKLDKNKYEIELLLLYNQGIYLEEIKKRYKVMALNKGRENLSKIPILRKMKSLFLKIKISILTSSFFANRIISNSYDIEIAFLEGYSTKLIANRKNTSKKLAWIHTDLEKHRIFNKRLEKKVYSTFNKIITVSKDSAASVKRLYPLCEEKIRVVYNPIDVEQIRKMAKVEQVAYSKNSMNLVTVGRLTYEKGYDILLKVHKELIQEGYKYKLYILGEGNKKDEFIQYIKENNLEKTVELVGFRKNPYPYIDNADVFIVSSRYEGYSLAVGEAIALGKPIVATKCTGPRELLDNGRYGIMVECENKESLKDGIKQLITNEEKRKYYSKISLDRSKIFNIKETIKEVESLFDQI